MGWFAALAIAVIVFLAILPNLSTWWLNPDEGIYYSVMTQTDSTQFWNEIANNAHPPLYYLATRAMSLITTDFTAIRMLSLFFGSVAVFMAWMVGKEIFAGDSVANSVGLIAALILAFSPDNSTMSQVMRPYAMLLALLLLALYELLRYRNIRTGRYLGSYSVLLSLALLTHYSSFLAFGVFAILILSDFITGRFGRREILPMLIAHSAPLIVGTCLYLFHLRPRLIGSAMAVEALDGWLAPLMIHSLSDVAVRLYGFMGYLVSGQFAGPALLLWFAGLVVATAKRCWTVLILNLGACGIGIFVAAIGKYPFGPSRHSSWLSAFMVFSISLVLAQMFTQKGRSRIIAATLIVLLVAFGMVFDRAVGKTRASTNALGEQILKKSDVRVVRQRVTAGDGPKMLVMSRQTYYMLLPLYVSERDTIENSTDSAFFYFRWDSKDVVVINSWNFSARPEDIGEQKHLLNFVRDVDKRMPYLGLGDDNRVLMVFAGWYEETPVLLRRADTSLPQGARLISNWEQAPGLTVFEFDMARYCRLMRESLRRRYR